MHDTFDGTGIYPAVVTSKKTDGSVNLLQIKATIDFLLSKGVDGIHVLGTTGEFASLTVKQRKMITEACMDAMDNNGKIIVHVGSVSTEIAKDLSKHASDLGADAISSVPPYYYPVTRDIVLRYYHNISEVSDIPVIIYDNPRTTGFTIDVELARELATSSNVQGIKIARNDMYTLARFANIRKSNFFIYPVETFYLSGLVTAQSVGTIGSMSNWIPEAFIGIKKKF
jgi:N-acetylneuraminate lyase